MGRQEEFWKQILKKESMGKTITEVMNKIYETEKFAAVWKVKFIARDLYRQRVDGRFS
jgi:hypothetical protein